MEANQHIGFALVNIKTEQFALLEDNFDEQRETQLNTGLEFKFNEEQRLIGSFIDLTFEQEGQPFIKIAVSCHFDVDITSWELCVNEGRDATVFPRNFMVHLAMLTIGTLRGVLFAKTEGTKFSSFIVPSINAQELIKEDVTLVAGAQDSAG